MKKEEHNLQMQIVYFLKVNHIFCFAVPNGGNRGDKKYYRCKDGRVGSYSPAGKRLKEEGALAGVSDLIIVLDGKTIYVEIKLPKQKQSDSQKEFEKNITNLNHKYIVWTSLDDAINFVLGLKENV